METKNNIPKPSGFAHPVRICLIGCGIMANDGHGPALQRYAQEYEGVTLAGCCDIDATKAEAYRKKFGFERAYTDYRAMLDTEKPDGVTLVTPTHLTAAIAMEVLKMGYPVLMEKPPARDVAEMQQLLQVIQETGLPNRVCFNRRFTPLTRQLLRLRKGDTNPIRCITGQMYRVGRTASDFETTAIHIIDTALYLADSPLMAADFDYQALPHYGQGVVNMYMTLRFENGAIAQLTVLPLSGVITERVSLSSDEYTYYVEYPFYETPDRPGQIQKYHQNILEAEIRGDQLAPSGEMYEECGFYEEVSSFYEALRKGETIEGDASTCLQSVLLEECIRQRVKHWKK